MSQQTRVVSLFDNNKNTQGNIKHICMSQLNPFPINLDIKGFTIFENQNNLKAVHLHQQFFQEIKNQK